ncbi:MAG: prepilin-type N-terminal cleavage/methylation domain-containing protein [Candidatus Omnitrophica bacterium]|nr:prepilin-type N-terminal cleavage/methylation domain-containing protein [Candidatus Omnitrophota bacterium]
MLKNRKNRAFSLVEVLVAMVVMVATLGGVFMLFSKGSMLIAQIASNDLVIDILEEQVELIRETEFDDIITNFFPKSTFSSTGFVHMDNPLGEIVIDYPFGSSIPNDKIIRVTVTLIWDSSLGRTLSKSLVTYITKGGISS